MMDHIRRVFLVDYENTSIRGLYGISCLGENCKVVVFCSSPVIQKAVEDVLKVYEMRSVEISTFLLIKPGKNALDFMISTYLGYEVNEAIDKEIFIVSSDHGFESATEMAKQLDRRMTIVSHRNIFECLPAYMRQGRYDIEEGFLLENKSQEILLLDNKEVEKEPEKKVIENVQKKPSDTGAKKNVTPQKTVKPTQIVEKKHTSQKESVVSSILGALKKKTQKEQKHTPSVKKEVSVTKTEVVTNKEKTEIETKAVPEKKVETKPQKESVSVNTNFKDKPVTEKKVKEKPQRVIVEVIEEEEKTYPALSKNKKQKKRADLMEKLKEETKIPEKLHLGLASAMVNAVTYSECEPKTDIILGNKNITFKKDVEHIFKKYR